MAQMIDTNLTGVFYCCRAIPTSAQRGWTSTSAAFRLEPFKAGDVRRKPG